MLTYMQHADKLSAYVAFNSADEHLQSLQGPVCLCVFVFACVYVCLCVCVLVDGTD